MSRDSVTPSDVLEALVGDVEDPRQAPMVRRGDGSWLVDGLMDARELKERLGSGTLPDEGRSITRPWVGW